MTEPLATRARYDADTHSAARALREGAIRLSRRLRAHRQEHGVSGTSIAILSRLYRDGEMTPKALADAEGTQPQALTRSIAALEEQGLIGRRDDPRDRRQVLLDVTTAGIRLLGRHSAGQVAWLAEAMDAELTMAEREILRVAATLLERLADHRPGPPPEPGP